MKAGDWHGVGACGALVSFVLQTPNRYALERLIKPAICDCVTQIQKTRLTKIKPSHKGMVLFW